MPGPADRTEASPQATDDDSAPSRWSWSEAGSQDEHGSDHVDPAGRHAVLRSDRLVLGFDLAATFTFALEGGIRGVQADLDILGVLVIAFVSALGGGILRDVLIGDIPPAAFRLQRYILTAFFAGLAAFAIFDPISHIPSWILVWLDAVGLSLFAVSGASKSLLFGCNALTAVLLGALTGAGGGAIRDVILNRIPTILYLDVYAPAALIGAAVMTIGVKRGLPRARMMVIGGAICFVIRVLGASQHLGLPHASTL